MTRGFSFGKTPWAMCPISGQDGPCQVEAFVGGETTDDPARYTCRKLDHATYLGRCINGKLEGLSVVVAEGSAKDAGEWVLTYFDKGRMAFPALMAYRDGIGIREERVLYGCVVFGQWDRSATRDSCHKFIKILGPRDFQQIDPAKPDLGTALRESGRYAEAGIHLKRALEYAEQACGPDGDETASAANNLGVLYKYTGGFAAAEALYNRALRILEDPYGTDCPEAATVLHKLGGLEHARGRFAEGKRPRVELTSRLCALGPDDPMTVADGAALAGILDGLGRYRESEPLYRKALAFFERLYGPVHYEIAVNLNKLAAVNAVQGNPAEAERLYRRSLAMKEELFGRQHPDVALTLHNLGSLLARSARRDEAQEQLREALAIFERSLPPGHPNILASREKLRGLVGVCHDNSALFQ